MVMTLSWIHLLKIAIGLALYVYHNTLRKFEISTISGGFALSLQMRQHIGSAIGPMVSAPSPFPYVVSLG